MRILIAEDDIASRIMLSAVLKKDGIRQIPSEELIRQSLKMDEIIGLLLNKNA